MPYEPGVVADFYEASLPSLGAICERTWHNRMEVLAEGPAARLWNSDGSFHSCELQFAAADAASARDAAREVFPGCPLTFQLADALRPSPPALERFVVGSVARDRPPDPAVAERLWRAQFADTQRFRMMEPFLPTHHFSLVVLARCEIQAIDQHWSLHRLALSLPGGDTDEGLAQDIGFEQTGATDSFDIDWPAPDPARWSQSLRRAIESDVAGELVAIRARQEARLRRELCRIDDYFEGYARELKNRASRSASAGAQAKLTERLAAAKSEQGRHRADQLARHEICVHPHVDALLLVAEPAWRCRLEIVRDRRPQSPAAIFVPRARCWEIDSKESRASTM